MLQDKFKRNGGVYKCQTFGTLQSSFLWIKLKYLKPLLTIVNRIPETQTTMIG